MSQNIPTAQGWRTQQQKLIEKREVSASLCYACTGLAFPFVFTPPRRRLHRPFVALHTTLLFSVVAPCHRLLSPPPLPSRVRVFVVFPFACAAPRCCRARHIAIATPPFSLPLPHRATVSCRRPPCRGLRVLLFLPSCLPPHAPIGLVAPLLPRRSMRFVRVRCA